MITGLTMSRVGKGQGYLSFLSFLVKVVEAHTRSCRPVPSTPRRIGRGEAFHVCLFSLSLTGIVFAWYAILPSNSINPEMI
jgi:hypothetical protein